MLSHMLSNLKVNQSHLLAWQVEFTSFSSLIIEPWLYSNNPLKSISHVPSVKKINEVGEL